jgi:energy-coupling factor transporter ATP-binding protein EcfA2
MNNPFICSVPIFGGGTRALSIAGGTSTIIVGANGSGKTRLGVLLENQIPPRFVQRIAAQKSLTLRDDLSLVSFERASNSLRFGGLDWQEGQKLPGRWGNKPATHLLNDFDALMQALFGAHNRVASKHLKDRKSNPNIEVPVTKLEELTKIWGELLPHRILEIKEASVQVLPAGGNPLANYSGSEMSDGERGIFYFLGQSLMAPDNAVIIVDEPESHVHKAILRRLWNAIEGARPDCGFVYITHDLDFAASSSASAKYFIRSYRHVPQQWDLHELPEDTGLPDDVVIEIVGSRKPILFIEGESGSLDLIIYGSHYTNFTLVPVGSCDNVIHSVASYKNSAVLHNLSVRGLVDADDRNSAEITNLRQRDIYPLAVAEIENCFSLPNIFLALAEALMCPNPPELLEKLKETVLKEANSNIDLVSARHTARQIDRKVKSIEMSSSSVEALKETFQNKLSTINPSDIFEEFKSTLRSLIDNKDLIGVMRIYDSKGVLSLVASTLGLRNQRVLLEKVSRLLNEPQGEKLRDEFTKTLPAIPV